MNLFVFFMKEKNKTTRATREAIRSKSYASPCGVPVRCTECTAATTGVAGWSLERFKVVFCQRLVA